MSIKCDSCKKRNKLNYRTFFLDTDNGKQIVTWCYDCIGNPPNSKGMTSKKAWEHINTPYWKLMGLKPKPKDIAYEKQLKAKNMTYGDAAMERSLKAQNQSAIGEWKKTYEGRGNETPQYEKN